MKTMPFSGGFAEHNDPLTPPIDTQVVDTQTSAGQQHMHRLMDAGFLWDEAVKLISLRDHLYENQEMRQRMELDLRIQFARWLLEHGEISEG
jgi:hypothetical protein